MTNTYGEIYDVHTILEVFLLYICMYSRVTVGASRGIETNYPEVFDLEKPVKEVYERGGSNSHLFV